MGKIGTINEDLIEQFFSNFTEDVSRNSELLRQLVKDLMPDIKEQLDVSAKLLAFCYGQKYSDLICVIIPSKKGLKLGFNRGVELDDINNLLKGKGKVSRYVEIKSQDQLKSPALKSLLMNAFYNYKNNNSVNNYE